MGYTQLTNKTQILALSNKSQEIASLATNQTNLVVLKQTAFYAKNNKQISNQGLIKTTTSQIRIINYTKNINIFLHHIKIISNKLKTTNTIKTKIELSKHHQTTTNHSTTHLIHSTLRKILNNHITQTNSLIDNSKTHFDFTHNKPLSSDEVAQIEKLINNEIAKASPISTKVMPHKQALAKNTMALFNEKYGNQMHVLTMGGFSYKLCSRTHVSNTAEIRVFKITSESGVSSGIRHIEAITNNATIEHLMKNTNELLITHHNTSIATEKSISNWIKAKKDEVKDLQKQIKKIQSGQINIDDLLKNSKQFQSSSGPAQLIFADLNIDDHKILSQISDQLKNKIQRGIIVTIKQSKSSHPVIISISKDLNSQFKAEDLLKDFTQILNKKNNNHPNFTQGTVPNHTKLKDAIELISKKILQ